MGAEIMTITLEPVAELPEQGSVETAIVGNNDQWLFAGVKRKLDQQIAFLFIIFKYRGQGIAIGVEIAIQGIDADYAFHGRFIGKQYNFLQYGRAVFGGYAPSEP